MHLLLFTLNIHHTQWLIKKTTTKNIINNKKPVFWNYQIHISWFSGESKEKNGSLIC